MIIYLLIFFGLLFGSFINAFEWRYSHFIDDEGNPKSITKIKKRKFSILHGRSMCPNCEHVLGIYDLFPVVSWIFLRGRCRYCKHLISKQYPLIETLTAILFVTSYVFWPVKISGAPEYVHFMSWLIILTGFISLSLFDFKKFLLPSRIVYSLVFITVISLIVRIILLKNTAIIFDPLLSAIVFFSFFYFILMFSRGEWIGGGDVRLAFLLGLQFTSPVFVFITLFLSSLFGLLFSLPMILKNRKKITTQIPFGPFLIFSAFVSVIWGERIINWYTNLLR